MKNSAVILGVALLFSGCAGYHLGPATPRYLRDVHAIAVPTFKNSTLVPRIEALITSTVVKQLQQDGSLRVTNEDQADAVLKGEIVAVSRNPARSLRGNVLATTEFNLVLRLRYSLVGRDGNPLGATGEVAGATSFFVGTDVTTDERQALPLAAEEMATHLVSQLTEGW